MEKKMTIEIDELVEFIKSLRLEDEVDNAMRLGMAFADYGLPESEVWEASEDMVKSILEQAKAYFNFIEE